MKTTYKIILGFMISLFIGCGGGSSSTNIVTVDQDIPKSPVHSNQKKSPPSIPKI